MALEMITSKINTPNQASGPVEEAEFVVNTQRRLL
jgi:hypothetical protein